MIHEKKIGQKSRDTVPLGGQTHKINVFMGLQIKLQLPQYVCQFIHSNAPPPPPPEHYFFCVEDPWGSVFQSTVTSMIAPT